MGGLWDSAPHHEVRELGCLSPNPVCCWSRAVSGAWLPSPQAEGCKAHTKRASRGRRECYSEQNLPRQVPDPLVSVLGPWDPGTRGLEGSEAQCAFQAASGYMRPSPRHCQEQLPWAPPTETGPGVTALGVLYPKRYLGPAGASGIIGNVRSFNRTALSSYSLCLYQDTSSHTIQLTHFKPAVQ